MPLWREARVVVRRQDGKPDLTLSALGFELTDRGVKVSLYAVWNFLRREGVSFKKTLHAAEQDRPDVARQRARWKRHQHRIDPRRLVFIDETWAKTNMTRTHGRSRRGERLVAKVPHGAWKTLTFVAALRHDRIEAPMVLDGPINGDGFRAWVEQALIPTLQPGDVVVLDTLGSHKGKAVRQAIRRAGVHLLFLPPYSPDLNPIEQVLSKLKTLLRKADERTVEATWRRIGSLLDGFKPNECANLPTKQRIGVKLKQIRANPSVRRSPRPLSAVAAGFPVPPCPADTADTAARPTAHASGVPA